MAFFKRPEVWLLLVLSVAGVAWVLWSDQEKKRAEQNETDPAVQTNADIDPKGARFEIRDRRISREQDHFVLTLRIGHRESLKKRSATEEPLEPKVSLVTEAGESVPSFFLPFDPPPVLDADPGAFLDLRFWLPAAQATGALWLEFEGDRLPVKAEGSAAVSADRFPEGIEVAVRGTEWTVSARP